MILHVIMVFAKSPETWLQMATLEIFVTATPVHLWIYDIISIFFAIGATKVALQYKTAKNTFFSSSKLIAKNEDQINDFANMPGEP